MRAVWKYELATEPVTTPPLHSPAVVHVGLDPAGTVCAWVEHYLDEPLCSLYPSKALTLTVVGTGHVFDLPGAHCGSVTQGEFVWHVYEEARTSS